MLRLADAGGGIEVRCVLQGGCIRSVTLAPRRIPPVARLAVGRTPEQIPGLFASLLSLCPHAHGLAALQALAAALELQLPAAWLDRRQAGLELEIIKEHTLNLLQPAGSPSPLAADVLQAYRKLCAALEQTRHHWPQSRLAAVDGAALASGMDCLASLLQSLCGAFWHEPDEADLAGLLGWQASADSPAACLLQRYSQPGWPAFGRCTANLLPSLPEDRLASWLADAPAAMIAPSWEGVVQETGSYARQAETPLIRQAHARFGNGLYTRTLARLVEIKALFQHFRQRCWSGPAMAGSPPPAGRASGIGLAQVEASRGRLIHRVELAEGRVSDYRILAPTEWNFHPAGLVGMALTGAPVTAELPEQIAAWLRAVDPCVGCSLRLIEA